MLNVVNKENTVSLKDDLNCKGEVHNFMVTLFGDFLENS